MRTFGRILQRADVLLTPLEVDREIGRLVHHCLVPQIRGRWEAAVERYVPFLLRLRRHPATLPGWSGASLGKCPLKAPSC